MLCKVQVIKHAAHYCVFAHSCLVNYSNIKTTTLNFEMSLFRMFFKHYCKVELEAKFGAKFFSRLAILQPVKLAFDCHWYFDTGSESIWVVFFLSEAFHSLLYKRNVYIFNHNRVKVLALSLFIRHKFMLIKARHRNAREKIKFLKLVVFDDVIGFSRVNPGFYLVRIGDDIQQKCCSRTYKHAKLNLLNKTW